MRRIQRLVLFDQGVNAWNEWRANNPTEKPNFEGTDLSEFSLSGAHLSGVDLSSVNFSGVNLSKAYLNETRLRGANLARTDLRGAHLIEADLSEADLSDANLTHTYLMEADLSGADLSGADLSEASLRGTNFHQANLENANFSNADIREANFSEANLSGVSLRKVNFSKKNLSGSNLEKADLGEADLIGADLSRARVREADLSRTNLSGANLSGADLSKVNLEGADLCMANLSGANLFQANLSEADLWGADLSGADLSGADLRGANLKEVDFRGANLSETNFRGFDLWGKYLLENDVDFPLLPTCKSDGMSAWNVKIDETTVQSGLVITQSEEPMVCVDNFEIAQVIYLLLSSGKIRSLIDMITSKAVLILGRFTPERKAILDAIRDGLRKHGYLPVLFDFEKPGSRNFIEMISTLAHVARFVIADFTDARSILEEMPHIVRNTAVPVQPLLESSGEEPFPLYNLRKNHGMVLDTYRYTDSRNILESLETQVIFPAEAKVKELGRM